MLAITMGQPKSPARPDTGRTKQFVNPPAKYKKRLNYLGLSKAGAIKICSAGSPAEWGGKSVTQCKKA